MITKLTNIELNVLAVALDHMEDHLRDLTMLDLDDIAIDKEEAQKKLAKLEVTQNRFDAVKSLQTKLL